MHGTFVPKNFNIYWLCYRQGPQSFLFSKTHLSRLALRDNQPYVQWGSDLFPAVKHTGHDIDHSHPSGTKVKENVDLYLNFPSPFHLWEQYLFLQCPKTVLQLMHLPIQWVLGLRLTADLLRVLRLRLHEATSTPIMWLHSMHRDFTHTSSKCLVHYTWFFAGWKWILICCLLQFIVF